MIHLTGHRYNSREIIQNVFSPIVGVATSDVAAEVCQRNNLSFVELMQPFARLQNEAHFRDVSGTVVSVRGLHLNFCDIDWRPPQTLLARKMLNESVNNANSERTKLINVGDLSLEVPNGEPWFEQWRETFLTVQFPSDHEFTRHLLSCLIILSSGDPAIVETAEKLTQRLQQMQSMTPQKLPKWFHPNNVLNSYVVLHEGSQGDISQAQQGYELLKSTFGDSKCFLIQINSMDSSVVSNEVPDYWKAYIKKQPKPDPETVSAPKTPQELISTIAMPTLGDSALIMESSTGSGSGGSSSTTEPADSTIFHPLSPVQERATEAIVSKFSISCESIASQTINPNVWRQELDADMPHGQCLNAMDIENLRHFVQDYSVRALIPYIENLVAVLTEAITNKKGVSKSLLSATKRWFATSKPGAGASQNAVIYTNESTELQTRKLGDLYFMFGHYNLAFQAYHQAKRDFNADSAWQYYAGALEMAAVAAFMLGTSNRKTYDYMEDAIVCYLTVCKLQQFATRATLLSMECLKTAHLYGEAAKQLIRMTSEESDLRSALLLEQAAYCYLAIKPPMYRKYAFNIVLAGNRYSRACQRKHAYRSYKQAYQIFQGRGWGLAEDHIQYTMAKQAFMLKKLDDASQAYACLLRPGSLQSAQQQLIILKEYIQTQTELNQNPDISSSSSSSLQELVLPKIMQNSIRILLLPYPPIANPMYIPANHIDIKYDFSDESLWHKIEEMIVMTVASNKAFVFKPSCNLYSRENLTNDNPLAIQGEPIEIAVTLMNTVRCNITLNDINLIWKLRLDNDNDELTNICLYEKSSDSSTSAAINAAIKSSSQTTTLDELAEKTLYFKLTPKVTGNLNIVGLFCQVSITAEPTTASLKGILHLEAQKLKQTARQSTQTLFDNKLSIKVLPQVPSLSVCFSQVPLDIVMGEIVPVTISLRNSGILPIEDVYVGCDSPRWLTFLDKDTEVPINILSQISDLTNEKIVKEKEIRKQRVYHLLKRSSSEAAAAAMKPQECATIQMWIQAPYESGEFKIRMLFYYSIPTTTNTTTSGGSSLLKYRLVRHTWKFRVHEALCSEVTCVVSNTSTGDQALSIKMTNGGNMFQKSLANEIKIDSVSLYGTCHRLTNKVYLMDQMEVEKGSLKPCKSMSILCPLQRLNKIDVPKGHPSGKDLLKMHLTHLAINETINANKRHVTEPPLEEMYGFLAKHETIFFNPNMTSEEFNNTLTLQHNHLTLVISWSATILQNSGERAARGMHFIKLHNLFETNACPNHRVPVPAALPNSTEKSNIDLFQNVIDESDEDSDDEWEPNDVNVAQRCLLEDPNILLTVS